jgi:hypothetical protein
MNATPRPARSLSFGRLSSLAAACAVGIGLALPASAQWAWKDNAGRTVYSDQPPPPTVRKEQVLRQPSGGMLVAPAAPAAAPAGPSGSATKPDAGGPKSLAEREQEFRKRQQERAEAERKESDAQALAARKRQDCERARNYLRALEEGVRISRTDAQGNREFLDDAARASETARAREAIAATCN